MTQQPDPWSAPASPGESTYPSLKQLGGRLVFIEPKQLELNVPDIYNPGKTKDRVTVDITFLDGDTLTVALDKEDRATPLPEPIPPGKTIEGMYVSQTVLVTQLKKAMRQNGGTGMVLGRLVKGESRGTNNAPWLLAEASPADSDVARRWYAWRLDQQARGAMGQSAPAPQQQPAPQAPAQQYQQPVQQAPQYAAPMPQAAPVYPQQAPAPHPPGGSFPQAPGGFVPADQGPPPGWSTEAAQQAQAPAQQPAQQQYAPQVGGPAIDPAPSF